MTNFGEEAIQIGSARALKFKDVVFPQYREAGVFLWRGYTPLECMHQCFGTSKDFGKGKYIRVILVILRLGFLNSSYPRRFLSAVSHIK